MVKRYFPLALLSIGFVILLMSLSPTIPIQNQNQPLPTQSQTPTEVPWKTYRNEKYGFEFQYPSSWSQVNPEGDEFSVGNSQNNCSFSFDITNKLKVTLPIQSWVNKQIKTNQERIGGPGYYVGTDNSNTTIVDGIKTVIYSTGNEGSDNTSYLFSKNNKIFALSSYLYIGDSFEQCNQQITQILSTFKFIPDTSTWKTYKNDDLGIEIEYPVSLFSSPEDEFTYINFKSVIEYPSDKYFGMQIKSEKIDSNNIRIQNHEKNLKKIISSPISTSIDAGDVVVNKLANVTNDSTIGSIYKINKYTENYWGKQGGEVNVVYVEWIKKNYIYSLSFGYTNELTVNKNLNTIKKIASTLKFADQTKYICPTGEWVDCMPGPGVEKPQCQPEYLKWAKDYCPNFKGAAL